MNWTSSKLESSALWETLFREQKEKNEPTPTAHNPHYKNEVFIS